MTLSVDKDGQTEGASIHSSAGEPELITNGKEAPKNLKSVTSSWLLKDCDFI